MAFVIGTPRAQAILLNVQDDFIVSSGVYAIRIHLLSKCEKAADELDSPFVNLNISLMFKQNENH
jgi:hypothetical protein